MADPGLRSGGPKIFPGKGADGAKRSHANEVSFNEPGSRAHPRAGVQGPP